MNAPDRTADSFLATPDDTLASVATIAAAEVAVTDEQLRAAGFSSAARQHPRDELAMGLLCAFVGVRPDQAPPAWWFHPNAVSHEAWKRVADYARTYFATEHAPRRSKTEA